MFTVFIFTVREVCGGGQYRQVYVINIIDNFTQHHHTAVLSAFLLTRSGQPNQLSMETITLKVPSYDLHL